MIAYGAEVYIWIDGIKKVARYIHEYSYNWHEVDIDGFRKFVEYVELK